MKYANLYWQNTETKNGVKKVNIGDNLQFMAIDNLYRKISLPQEEIVYLKIEELCHYKGEYLILPMNWSLFDSNYMQEDKISISPYIIPVFLAVTIESAAHQDRYFNEYNIKYLKQYEPIGCRDEYTMQMLRDNGISAYLNGCMTLTFDKRDTEKLRKKIFAVDAPKELEWYMPEELKKHCEVLTQQYYYNEEVKEEAIIKNIKAQYSRYAEEAALIITSRLHVAAPAVALGIPVIFAREKIDYRFSWIDKLLPLYEKKDYDKIKWNPDAVECEEIKKKMLENAIKRVTNAYATHSYYEISEFYENRKKGQYVKFQETILGNLNKAYEFIENRFGKDAAFFYSVWGLTEGTEKFYDYMQREYPNAKLRCVIDLFQKEKFHGIETIKPEMFQMVENEVVVVLAVKASNMAQDLFEKKGIQPEAYVCIGDLFLKDRQES